MAVNGGSTIDNVKVCVLRCPTASLAVILNGAATCITWGVPVITPFDNPRVNPLGSGGSIPKEIFPKPPDALTGATFALLTNLIKLTVDVSKLVVKPGKSITDKLKDAVL